MIEPSVLLNYQVVEDTAKCIFLKISKCYRTANTSLVFGL
jgi:hypothetical protein